MKVLVFFLSFMLSSAAYSAVWQANTSWDAGWQARYSQWIASQVGPNFFKELGYPYSDLAIDCADAHYALMAYFAFQNGLEFSIDRGAVTNNTDRFDHIGGTHERLAAFMRYLAGYYGTESLVHTDTYPVAVRDIRPGDLFMYKIGTHPNFTRHTYIVKNINLDGTFDVLYSTQARRDAGLPLNRHQTYMFTKAPLNTGKDANRWGFRRGKMPQHAAIPQEQLSLSNFSQYPLARQLGQLEFFREVKRIHQKVAESPTMALRRNFNTVCKEGQERVEVVRLARQYVNSVGGRCLTEQEYDSYSTPSRDIGIVDKFRHYIADYHAANRQGSGVDMDLLTLSYLILAERPLNSSEQNRVLRNCPINTGIGPLDLSTFRRNLFAGHVSFHPNDNEYLRWGFRSQGGPRTSCKTFYGYPVTQ